MITRLSNLKYSSFGVALLIAVWAAGVLSGCKPKTEEQVDYAAKAHDKVLTWQEVYDVIPDNATDQDSIYAAENFINNWVRQQAIVHHAQLNLSEEQKDFTKQLEDYRNSLLTFAFEEQYVRQRLDTAVSEEVIEQYYEENQDNFLLKDYIVRVKFCILDKETPRLRKFEKLFYSDDAEDLTRLEQFCVEYKARYFLKEDMWIYFDDLLKQVPLDVVDTESFLKKNKQVEFERGNNLFYLNILEYKIKDSVSPLSFQRDRIENIIINQRKVALLNDLRDGIYREALDNKQIEINLEK
ncbi:hypothetical protein [Halocola ammonii]